MVQFLITNHGIQHSPEKWGHATAVEISPFDMALSGDRLAAAECLRARFTAICEKFHATLQSIERSLLEADADHILSKRPPELVEPMLEELIAATKGTPWEFQWNRADVQVTISEIIESHFETNQHLERLQWASDHPDDVAAQIYQTQFR